MSWKKGGIIVGVFAGTFLIMKYVVPVMLPFLLGALLALAVWPAAGKIVGSRLCGRVRIKQRTVGCALVLLLAAGGIGGFVWMLQEISENAGKVVDLYPVIKKEFIYVVGECCNKMESAVGIPAGESVHYIHTQLGNIQSAVLQSDQPVEAAVSSVKKCIVFAGGIALSLISAILIIQEREIWKKTCERWPMFERIKKLLWNLWSGICGYVGAQFKIMGIIIFMCMAGMFLLGAEHFLLVGLFLGILDALPILGTGTFLLPAAFFLFIKGRIEKAAGCLILYAVTACTRQFLEPRIVGKKVGVSPLLVLLSVYLGVFLYGGSGVVLGPLSAYLIYGILKEWNLLEVNSDRKYF